ncbi:MAG: DUF6141 family protein [Candidatus Thermoplasmatota archaeon]|nr:DUF6141 family protein [Candidatus Thermoplasmatota archaeon]
MPAPLADVPAIYREAQATQATAVAVSAVGALVIWTAAAFQLFMNPGLQMRWATLAGLLATWCILGVCFPCFVLLSRLETTVDARGISVRLFPLHLAPRTIPWDDIADVQAHTYRPLRDMGGWGARFGFDAEPRAYAVRGSRGILLTFRDGRPPLLLGSQNPHGMVAAIQRARSGGVEEGEKERRRGRVPPYVARVLSSA